MKDNIGHALQWTKATEASVIEGPIVVVQSPQRLNFVKSSTLVKPARLRIFEVVAAGRRRRGRPADLSSNEPDNFSADSMLTCKQLFHKLKRWKPPTRRSQASLVFLALLTMLAGQPGNAAAQPRDISEMPTLSNQQLGHQLRTAIDARYQDVLKSTKFRSQIDISGTVAEFITPTTRLGDAEEILRDAGMKVRSEIPDARSRPPGPAPIVFLAIIEYDRVSLQKSFVQIAVYSGDAGDTAKPITNMTAVITNTSL